MSISATPGSARFDFTVLPDNARETLEALRKRGISFWLVGGFVRDWAAGHADYRDIDIAIDASVHKIRRLAGGEIIRCRHPHVLLDDLELLPCRDIGDSLKERDFTCNALAIDSSGRLIDPFGGARDAAEGVFRMVSRRGLSEDPIRIVRACRLAARLGWRIGKSTDRAMRQSARQWRWAAFAAKYSLKIAVELRKVFEDAEPSRFFLMAHDYGALHIVMPPLESLFNSQDGASALLANCDSAPRGNFTLRTWALMRHLAGRQKQADRKSAAIGLEYLRAIKWDVVAGEFGRVDPLADAETLAFMLRRHWRPLESERALLDLARAASQTRLTAGRFALLSEKLFSRPLPGGEAALKARLEQMAENAELARDARLAVLRFAGYSKSAARRRLDKQVQAAE